MGNCNSETDRFKGKQPIIADDTKFKGDFQLIRVVGRGGFGCVWKVVQKKTSKIFALKIMDKAKIIAKKSVKSVQNQRKILQELAQEDCRLIVKMQGAFQDRYNLYLLLNFIQAGDLRQYINYKITFNQNQTNFLVRCLIYSLQILHKKNILHRDLKPQNIIIDSYGYAHITDLGIARYWKPNNSKQTSGTPSYMAPEVLTYENYTFTADYYAIGVIAYELLVGRRPMIGKDRRSIVQEFLVRQPKIPAKMQKKISNQCLDFINKLLIRKKTVRLGANGIQQLLQHPWMSLSLEQQYKFRFQYIKSPIVPLKQSELQADQVDSQVQDEKSREAKLLLSKKDIQQLFENYQYSLPIKSQLPSLLFL